MKKSIALLVLALAACSPQTPEMPTASSQAVGAAFQNWINGWTGGDVEAVAAPFTEDAVIYHPFGDYVGSEGARAWAQETFAAMDGITIGIRAASVNVIGPTAWITGTYEWTATMTGEAEPFTETGKLSMLWVLEEDGSYSSPVFHASVRETPEDEADGG